MKLNHFREAIGKTPISLPRTSLLIAQSVAYDDLDINDCLARLDGIAEEVQESDVLRAETVEEQAENLAEYLFSVVGLRGDEEAYYDPRNSFLNEVLTRGRGIPITLSIIYVEIAKRVGLDAAGVALPGHFIVRVTGARPNVYIDPFRGLRLSVRACAELVRETTGYTGKFKPVWLNPSNELDILLRLLNNLRFNYMRDEKWEQVRRVIKHLRVVEPNDPTYLRDEALVAFNQDKLYESLMRLEMYLEEADSAEDAAIMRLTLGQILGQLAELN